MNVHTNDLEELYSDLSTQAETFSLTFTQDNGWSAPFPKVDSARTLIVVFAADCFFNDPTHLNELKRAFPKSSLVGSSANRTMNDGDLLEDSISVGIIKFQSSEIKFTCVDVEDFASSESAGRKIADDLNHPKLTGVLLFSDGINTEATDLVRGIQEVLPAGIPIAGGLAADKDFKETWVNANGELRTKAACAVGLVGDKVEMVCGSGGGWQLMSGSHIANKTVHKTIYEIDGRPAYEVYAEQVGGKTIQENPWSMVNYPLALNLRGLDLVRGIIACNQEEGWIQFAGDVPEGIPIQFMESTRDEVLDGVDEAAHRIKMKTVGLNENTLCIGISCIARVSILGDRTNEEAQLLRSSIGEDVCHIGMYGFGEISTTTCGYPQVHNQTMTAAVIREH